jgi:UDP-galactopyranose mutase
VKKVPYDFLVVGSGLFGSIFAQQATSAGYRCLVIDQRSHIGGNCYSEAKEGIHIHRYGPHLFHTNDSLVASYIQQFGAFTSYNHRVKAWAAGKLFSFPINLSTFYEIWGISEPHLALQKLNHEKIAISEPKNLEEWALSQVGPTLYNLFIKDYTKKQWQKDPKELPAFIIKRLPIRLDFNDNYFNDTFQMMPEQGYTSLFHNLLKDIEVRLNCDFFSSRPYLESLARHVVFTGRIDTYFNYSEGELCYRTQKFEDEWHESRNVQGCAVINYCDQSANYTRKIEHRHFDKTCQSNLSVITKEIPEAWSKSKIPYYPINTPENQAIYKRYCSLAQKLPHVFFGGRLGEYKYYDMHHVIASALAKSSQWIQQIKKLSA